MGRGSREIKTQFAVTRDEREAAARSVPSAEELAAGLAEPLRSYSESDMAALAGIGAELRQRGHRALTPEEMAAALPRPQRSIPLDRLAALAGIGVNGATAAAKAPAK